MLTIIHLTRQPEGRWKLPVPVKVYYEITVLFFTRSRTVIFYVSDKLVLRYLLSS